MPRQHYNIMSLRSNASYTSRLIGFGAYSEGAAADFNMMLWSYLASGRATCLAQLFQVLVMFVWIV